MRDKKIKFKNLISNDGKILRWPKKTAEKLFVLEYLQSKFEKGKIYIETEVNNIISEWHCFNDKTLLRCELYNRFLINREIDCSKYWV